MKFKQKLFVVIGLFLIIGVSAGIYVNCKLNRLVSMLNQPENLYSDSNTGSSAADGSGNDSNTPDSTGSSPAGTSGSGSSSVNLNGSAGSSSRPSNGDIAQGALSKVNRPVEKEDLIKAGLIVLRRLNSDEISYLYSLGMKENHSSADLSKARKILQAKLTPEELGEMQSLGTKYGKNLDFLSK